MRRNEVLEVVKDQLARYDIKPKVENTRGSHLRLVWQYAGKTRRYVIGRNATDTRARQNATAQVRRMLREDGII